MNLRASDGGGGDGREGARHEVSASRGPIARSVRQDGKKAARKEAGNLPRWLRLPRAASPPGLCQIARYKLIEP